MAKYEIEVEEVVRYNHIIVVEGERESLDNIPEPDCNDDITDFAFSDEVGKYAKLIEVCEDEDGYTDSFEITSIVPCVDE